MDDSEPPELPQPTPQMLVVVAVPPNSPNTSGSAPTPAPQVKEPDEYTACMVRTYRQTTTTAGPVNLLCQGNMRTCCVDIHICIVHFQP